MAYSWVQSFGFTVKIEDSPPDGDAIAETYYAASRPHAGTEKGQFGFWSVSGTSMQIKEIKITDL